MLSLSLKRSFVIIALIITSHTQAANWVYVGTDSSSNKFYIDTDSIDTHRFTAGGNYKTAWEKLEFATPKRQDYSPYQSYNESIDFWYYDCQAKKLDIEISHDYFNGQPIDSSKYTVSTHSSASWHRVVPDTVSEAKLDFVCNH